jgi:hypothetical protein
MSDTTTLIRRPCRLSCKWELPEGDKRPIEKDEHVLTAADFVVDEFELYGCGD